MLVLHIWHFDVRDIKEREGVHLNPLHLEMDRFQEWKLMSCSHVKNWVNLLTWLLIGCSLLSSQSGASLLVETTIDNDYNSKISIPGR